MKKSTKNMCLTLFCLMLGCTTASGQSHHYYDTRHEVGLTIGAGATTEIFSGLADMTSTMISAIVTSSITGGTLTAFEYSYGDESYIPTITAEYYYHVNKLIGLGGFVAFNGMSRDMYARVQNNVTGDISDHKTGKAIRRNFSIIPTAKFDWLRKKYFGLYSKLGVGVSFMYESQKDDQEGGTDFSDTDVTANLQVSLLGTEFGSPNIRGFLELGMGEQGILVAGLKYKF